MAKKTYIGVDGVARNVTGIYIGVDGVARKVIKGYIGVDGVARLFYDDSAKIITFSIRNRYGDETSLTALEGMTWEDWCDSSYNTVGIAYEKRRGGVYMTDDYGEYYLYNDMEGSWQVFKDDVITSGTTYYAMDKF